MLEWLSFLMCWWVVSFLFRLWNENMWLMGLLCDICGNDICFSMWLLVRCSILLECINGVFSRVLMCSWYCLLLCMMCCRLSYRLVLLGLCCKFLGRF